MDKINSPLKKLEKGSDINGEVGDPQLLSTPAKINNQTASHEQK